MYRLFDKFVSCNENKQPYSFAAEQHTYVDNMHAWVEDNSFKMSSVGNVYILNSPKVLNAKFNMKFKVTYMIEICPEFTVMFSYDEKRRKGYGLRFKYDLNEMIAITLVEINSSAKKCIKKLEKKTNVLSTDTYYDFELNLTQGKLSGNIAGADFEFDLDVKCGKLAIERADFIGELIIDYVSLESEDEFEREILVPKTKVNIPLTNGGDIPYELTWSIERIDEDFFFNVELDGGTKTRKVDREDRPGQYVAEKDYMTNPYVGIGGKDGRYFKYFIANGEIAFIDPNIYWDCQKGFFGDTDIPIVNTFKIPCDSLIGDYEIFFGYDNLFCSGYTTQIGGREFRFTIDGKLIYNGDATDGRDIYELYSDENKFALSFVPEDCYKREEVVEHIKKNHYYEVSEDAKFKFVFKTRKNLDYLKFETNLLDVYETKISSVEYNINTKVGDYGYNEVEISVNFGKLNIGVYKAELKVYYGDKEINDYVKIFEVFDKALDINPALASGLPFTFSMPNEQKRLMRNAFDVWTPMPSCDAVHLFNCITDTPDEAMTRKPWKITKKFKREWFAWISSRTCKDWNIDNYTDVVKNCDYLFSSINEEVLDLSQSTLFPIRQDHHLYQNFLMRKEQRLKILDDFLTENPEIAEKADYKIGSREFTYEQFINLYDICYKEWIEYQNKAGLEIIKENNEEVRRINPNVKRSIYGPLNQYISPVLSYHSLKIYGISDMEAIRNDIFTGFSIFEDYPYSCSYQTYRGAFFIMTLLLHSPNMRVYPEQYGGSKGGCIDGAVKFAHAPMGAYEIDTYQTSTHAFEFVYNTAHRLEDGFHYWNTYGFHRSAIGIENLVKDWKYVINNKPKKPLKTTAFLTEYSIDEDVIKEMRYDGENQCVNFINQSESGHGFIFECSRESGLPNGFAVKFDTLKYLTADDCDVLVIPSLKYAEKEYIDEIRRLYNDGVNLLAVSDVTGLEDIFGVEENEHYSIINAVCYNGKSEYVQGYESKIIYEPTTTKVVMTTPENEPIIMTNGRCAIINTSVTNLGSDNSKYMCYAKAPMIIGKLIKEAVIDVLTEISMPLIKGENVGTTLFETTDGRKMILAIDYSKFDNIEKSEKEATIKINMENVGNVKSEEDISICKIDGKVKEIRFNIKPHGFAFIELM